MRKLAETALSGKPCAYLSPIYPMLTEVYRTLRERLLPLVTRSIDGRRLELSTGGIIDLWSMENGGDRVRGRKYARVVLDEAAQVVDLLSVWEKVVRPTLADYQGDAFFVSTPKRGSGFEYLYRKDGDAGWKSWEMPTHANPFIAPEEIEEMAATMSEETYAAEILAKFEASGSDLVLPEFGPSMIRSAPVAWADCLWRVVGIDPGGGDPYAVIPLGIHRLEPVQGPREPGRVLSPYREHFHQFGELYRAGDVTPMDIDQTLKTYERAGHIDLVAVGETGGNFMTNTLASMGWPAVKADISGGAPKQGTEDVRLIVREGRFSIDPSCKSSLAEFGRYRWKKARDAATGEYYNTDQPDHPYSHAMDARRYGVRAVFQHLIAPKNGRVTVRHKVEGTRLERMRSERRKVRAR